LELTYVAWPGGTFDRPQGILSKPPNPAAVDPHALAQKMPRQQHGVPTALAKGGHTDRDPPDPVIEILAETLGGDQGEEILVGGADKPDVQRNGHPTPNPLDHPLLQNPQQFGLQAQGHLADLVEEDRAAGGKFQPTRGLAHGARESPAFVPEEFALQQILGDRGAVDRAKRTTGAIAQLVQRAGQQFLAGTTLTLQQHAGARWSQLLD